MGFCYLGSMLVKLFLFKSTLPLDEEPELANSLRKLGSKRGSELQLPFSWLLEGSCDASVSALFVAPCY